MIETKFIFLDIDGPIATDKVNIGKSFKIDKVHMQYGWDLDAVNALKSILLETNAKIILSSDWRKFYTFDEFKTIMNFYDINPDSLIGYTDNIPLTMSIYESNRTHEINRYIDINKIHDNKYCVIDDMKLGNKNLVHIKDTYKGINNPEIIEQILNFLK